MSTSLLYHVFGIHEYRHVRTRLVARRFSSRTGLDPVALPPLSLQTCHPQGAGGATVSDGARWSQAKLSGGSGSESGLYRLRGGSAGDVALCQRQEEPYQAIRALCPELSRVMTIGDVAAHHGICWDAVKEIVKRDLTRRFARPRVSKLKWLAIDEVHVGKKSSSPWSWTSKAGRWCLSGTAGTERP